MNLKVSVPKERVSEHDGMKFSLMDSRLRWCLFFWLFAESNLVLEFRLFVFLLFHDLL